MSPVKVLVAIGDIIKTVKPVIFQSNKSSNGEISVTIKLYFTNEECKNTGMIRKQRLFLKHKIKLILRSNLSRAINNHDDLNRIVEEILLINYTSKFVETELH